MKLGVVSVPVTTGVPGNRAPTVRDILEVPLKKVAPTGTPFPVSIIPSVGF